MNDKVKKVHEFIFNDDVQNTLSEINNNLMEFNILEITGMGNQEIKHSNILSWLLGDNEHNLEYQVLEIFLKKVAYENVQEDLHKYIYLADKEKDIKIYREKDNIDLLLVDEANDVVITIENKVFANESSDQLKTYEEKIYKKYEGDKYTKYFLFLTRDLDDPSSDRWLKASHKMIAESIEIMLETKKDITTKTKIILESYIDLLKRNDIVEDEKLEELCKSIWNKPKYKDALDTLFNYRPDRQSDIAEYLKKIINNNDKTELLSSQKRYTTFIDTRWKSKQNVEGKRKKGGRVVYYEFINKPNYLILTISIGPSSNQEFREMIFKESGCQGSLSQKHQQIYKNTILKGTDLKDENSLQNILGIINENLEKFFEKNGDFNKQYTLLKSLDSEVSS